MLKLQLATGQAVSEPWGHYTDGDISSGCRSRDGKEELLQVMLGALQRQCLRPEQGCHPLLPIPGGCLEPRERHRALLFWCFQIQVIKRRSDS